MDTKTRLLIESLGARDLTIINLQTDLDAALKKITQLETLIGKDNEVPKDPRREAIQ